MINKTIDIWEGYTYHSEGEDGFRPYMDTYILGRDKVRGAVLICPGGAYAKTSDREAEPIAMQFAAAGFHTFVLYYSVAPRKHPQPIRDVARAMTIIRENAKEWKVDPSKVAVCGFSAGGHLAASIGVFYGRSEHFEGVAGINQELLRPDALILGYPVITSGEYAHKRSYLNLLGEDADDELMRYMSPENYVTPDVPPTFIWHTYTDNAVPVENTLMFAQKLRENSVPFEMHVFPNGPHGLSLATEETGEPGTSGTSRHISKWITFCIEWLKETFDIVYI